MGLLAEYENCCEELPFVEDAGAVPAATLEFYEPDGSLWVDTVVPCPTCSEPIELAARVLEVTSSDVELPLYD